MNIGAVTGVVALLVTLATAATTFYRGWRRRIQDAATKPFQAGQAAITEAELALTLKDRRLADMAAREGQAVADLERAKAAGAAQQEQIASLYARIGELQTRNAALEEGARRAAEREEQYRTRISGLEASLAEVKKQIGLGQ